MATNPDPKVAWFECAVCGKTGEERWPEADEYVDDGGFKLPDAATTPNNLWACSKGCYSQAMYLAADKLQQEKLDGLLDALNAINECLDQRTRDFLAAWSMASGAGRCAERLLGEANGLFGAMTYEQHPAWTDRLTRVEVLEEAIRDASAGIEHYGCLPLSVAALQYSSREFDRRQCSRGFLAGEEAHVSASLGRILLALREAVLR